MVRYCSNQPLGITYCVCNHTDTKHSNRISLQGFSHDIQLLICYGDIQLLICYGDIQLLICYGDIQLLIYYGDIQLLIYYGDIQLLIYYGDIQLLIYWFFLVGFTLSTYNSRWQHIDKI